MQEYDVVLKLLLKGSATLTVRELTGTVIAEWLDVELPKIQKVQSLRLDLLGRTADGELIHIELQSSHDAAMPFRMIEYCLGVQRMFGQFPRQILLYVGEAPLHMESELCGPGFFFQYRLIDIRTLDGERLLGSAGVGDNVIAILAQLRDDKEAVHRIVEGTASLAVNERETALAQLMILAGLRHLAGTVEQETGNMPIDLDIRDHEVLGPIIIKAEQKALQKGRQEGLQEGMQAGELTVLQRLIEKRFGALPSWAREKMAAMPPSELEDLSERVLDARSVDELLR
jgi:predicted transposase YdaD